MILLETFFFFFFSLLEKSVGLTGSGDLAYTTIMLLTF